MRYRDAGNVHLEFHRSMNGAVAFLRSKYGEAFLDEILRRTAHDVYRSSHDDLKCGDPEQLIEHWTYYFDRENGECSLERSGEEIRFTVRKCPAVAYLMEHGIEPDEAFCRQTVVMNSAWSEGSPFEIETEVLGGGRCVQTIRRKTPDARKGVRS